MNDAKEFNDPETASNSGLSHVPSQPMSIPSPRGMITLDSCLQLDTRNSLGTSGRVFEYLHALFGNSKNLASSSCRLNPIHTGKIAEQREVSRNETQNCTTPTPRCREVIDLESSVSCRRNLSSKLYVENSEESDLGHFDKFPDTSGHQFWNTNFKTEVSSCSGCLTVAMLWIKEAEVAKSVDVSMTSQSIEGHVCHDFEMLDAEIASVLKRIITNQ